MWALTWLVCYLWELTLPGRAGPFSQRDDKDQIRKLENVVTTLCLFAKSQRDSDDSAAITFKIMCSLPFGIWIEHQGLLQEVPHPSLGLPSHPLESFPSLPVPCITRCSVP